MTPGFPMGSGWFTYGVSPRPDRDLPGCPSTLFLTLLTDLHRILMQLAVISGWLGLAFRGVCLISVDRSRGPWGIPTPSRLRPASAPQTVPESDGAATCTAPSPRSETCGWFAPHGYWSGLAG